MRLLFLLVFLALASASGAQPLTSAPPGFIEPARAVSLGDVVVEVVTTYQDVGAEGTDAISAEALARIGLIRGVEVILVAPVYARVAFRPEQQPMEGAAVVDGFGDPAIGLKVDLASVRGVDLALLAGMSLPLGGDAFGSSEVGPSVLLIGGTDFSSRFSLAAQGGAVFSTAPEIVEWSGALTLGAALGERAGAYVELTATDAAPESAPASILAYAGGTFSLLPALELDARIGSGLTEYAPDLLLSLGVIGTF